MKIYKKLQKVRVELQNMKLKKTGENKHSKFMYYELGDFLPAINVLCEKHGLMTHFNLISDSRLEKAVLRVFDVESPSDSIDFVSPSAEVKLPGGGQKIQNLGGKITYMRRYMLMTAFEIVESDLVETIQREKNEDLSEADQKKIAKTKSVKALRKTCDSLKSKYKVKVIKPYYKKQEEAIKVNQDGGSK